MAMKAGEWAERRRLSPLPTSAPVASTTPTAPAETTTTAATDAGTADAGPTGIASADLAASTLEQYAPDWQAIQKAPEAYIPASATMTDKVQAIDPNAPGTSITAGTGQITAPAPTAAVTEAAAPTMAAPTAVQATSVAPPDTTVAQVYNATQIDPTLVSDIQAATGTAAVADLRPEELVTAQLDTLLQDLQNDQVPSWAAPAVAEAEAILASRGMSSSSVGRDALFNTIIQAAMPLAQSNATALQQRSALNLSNEQQMAIANLSNEQQARLASAEQRTTALLSNQAASNAAAQFNASSENQTAQFMSTMRTQVETANADRMTNTAKFNAEQAAYTEAQNANNASQMAMANLNAQTQLAEFNAQTEFQRQQFNAQQALVLEQANVEWRRQVTTANNAIENAAIQMDVVNAFNLSNQALVASGQEAMDLAQWAFEASENAAQRQAMLAAAAAQKSGDIDTAMWQAVGSVTAAIIA